jgi:far upstream element-binding protein
MAEEAQYTLKRKYDDQPTAIDIKLEVANAKQKAQEAAARLLSATAAPPVPFDPKRTKSDNGAPQSGFDSYDLKAQYSTASYGSSKKIEIPNGRVGVLIGKSGETIKYLQLQSGAKIQVTRDMDADPNSTMRMVELTGTSDAVASAEKLINDVLAEVSFQLIS